jgi:hypothetical protein
MLPTEVEILDERVLQVSRAETGFKIAVDQTDKNILDIEFSILESGDGAAIQIIYAGSPSTTFAMDGSIVGQPNPHEEPLYSNEKDDPLFHQIKNVTNFDLFAILYISIGMITFIFLPGTIKKLGINPCLSG